MKKIISLLMTLTVFFTAFIMPINAADENSKAGVVSISSGTLNVRKSRSTSSQVLHSLKNGTNLTLMSKSGSWWKVEYADGKYGYSHKDYIKTVSSTPASVKIGSGTLNVRSGAGTKYSVKGSLSKGDTVLVLSKTSSWSKILYHGTKTGYVSSKYLSASGDTGHKYTAVKLSVPSFKQTDKRWANVTIGSSGKTIAQIGCVTTGIAMMESYRSDKTIYPDAMSKRLSYDSSGNIYWPSDYNVVTSSLAYLTKVYNLLKEGKPVLFGAKKSSGSQHWVVITGYTGGDTLAASGFTVNDPGSDTRTNLQQFMNVYPVFYKFFYY